LFKNSSSSFEFKDVLTKFRLSLVGL